MYRQFSSEVIVIDQTGTNLGIMPVGKAKQIARELELDLVEINKQNNISVCKIIDEKKWEYEQKKKKKSQEHTVHKIKEIKFGIRIDPHDQNIKINHIKKFIEKKHSVRIVVEIVGREKSKPEVALDKMNQILAELSGLVKHEDIKKSFGNIVILVHPA